MKYLSIFVVLIVAFQTASAQHLKSDLDLIYKKYNTAEVLQMEFVTRNYEGSFRNMTSSEHNKVYKDGNAYWYAMGEEEMLMNDSFIIWVDKDSKKMVCTLRNGGSLPTNASQLPDFNALLQSYEQTNYLGQKNQVKHYRMIREDALIKATDIYLDATSGLPKKLLYSYNEQVYGKREWVEMEFLKMDMATQPKPTYFLATRYIKQVNGTYQPTGKYADYELMMTN